MAKGNVARGRQKTLVSGENIKTIGGKSVLGSGDLDGQWKLVGSFEAPSEYSQNYVQFEPDTGFFTDFFSDKYTKYKIVLEALVPDSYTGIATQTRAYFKTTNSVGYRLIYTPGNSFTRYSSAYAFNAEFVLEKIGTNAVRTTLMPQAASQCQALGVSVATNPGIFETGATVNDLKYIYIDVMNASGFSFEEGTKVNLYALEV